MTIHLARVGNDNSFLHIVNKEFKSIVSKGNSFAIEYHKA